MSGFAWGPFGVNLALCAGAALLVMLVTFAIALVRGVHRIVDAAWGVGFAVVAAVSYTLSGLSGDGDPARRLLVLVLTAVWGLRLAVHIARRGRGHGEDPRYEKLLGKAPGGRTAYAFRMVYLLQGGLVWLISLPVQAAGYVPGGLAWPAYAGVALWACGMVFEAGGDHQLDRFRRDPANRGKIMDRGLWRYTRHPNYFGDFCVWWGVFLVAAGSWGVAALTVAGPLVISYLLVLGSGKRLLERHMAGRPGYAAYAARTSGFLPLPPRGSPHR